MAKLWPFKKRGDGQPSKPRRLTVMKSTTAPETTQLKDEQFSVLYDQGRAVEPPLDPLLLLTLGESNEMHSAALDAPAVDAAGRGFDLLAKDGVDDPNPAERKAVLDRLKFICPDYPVTELIYQAAVEMRGIGWSGWEVIRDQSNQIAAAYPVPGHTLRATKDRDVFVQVRDSRVVYFKRFGQLGFELDRYTGQRTVAGDPARRAAELIFFRPYSSRSSYYSIPAWISALPSLAELSAIRDFQSSYFESGGVLDKLIFISSRTDADEAVEQIDGLFRDARDKRHGAVVVQMPEDAKIQVEELAKSIKEGKGPFSADRENLNRAILIAHRVPPYRVGWAESGALGGNAAREMLRAYRWGVVEPLQTHLEFRLASTLFGPQGFNLQGWEFAFNDLDWSETDLSLKMATEGTLKGILTPNEGRELLGRQPAPDPALDRHYFNGKILDSTEDATKVLDVLKEIRSQFEIALSEEQEEALAAAETMVAQHDQEGGQPAATASPLAQMFGV